MRNPPPRQIGRRFRFGRRAHRATIRPDEFYISPELQKAAHTDPTLNLLLKAGCTAERIIVRLVKDKQTLVAKLDAVRSVGAHRVVFSVEEMETLRLRQAYPAEPEQLTAPSPPGVIDLVKRIYANTELAEDALCADIVELRDLFVRAYPAEFTELPPA